MFKVIPRIQTFRRLGMIPRMQTSRRLEEIPRIQTFQRLLMTALRELPRIFRQIQTTVRSRSIMKRLLIFRRLQMQMLRN